MGQKQGSKTKKSRKSQSKKDSRTASSKASGKRPAARKGASAKGNKAKKFDKVLDTIRKHEDRLRRIEGVDDIRPGYRIKNGWFTKDDDPVIVVEVSRKLDEQDVPKDQKIPRTLDGIPVDVTPTPPSKRLKAIGVEADAVTGLPGEAISLSDDLALPGWDREGEADEGEADEAEAEADSTLIPYKPPPGAKLDEFKDTMSVICHVSPDAGWATLKSFLQSVTKTLTVGMYDFTAPHILETLGSTMADASGNLNFILDPKESIGGGTKKEDVHEEDVKSQLGDTLGNRFNFVWAAVGHQKVTGSIFPSAYHIKVAVSGGRRFWLSSGNWQSSNQPDLDNIDLPIKKVLTKYNREWHVVIGHPGLAATYEKFLKGDIKQAKPLQLDEDVEADVPTSTVNVQTLIPESVMEQIEADIAEPKFFEPQEFKFTAAKPLRVQPLLTPDNFAENVLKVVKSAKKTLYFQNQYIKVGKKSNEKFSALLDALLGKIEDGLDVRFILRDIGDTRGMLEALRYYGFDLSLFKVQPGCHTKGIVVDSKTVVIGSHNWSIDGTTRNRDASLIFFNPQIAQYYEKVFLYDWDNLARQKIISEDAVTVVTGDESDALSIESDTSGAVLVPWDLSEDLAS